MGFVVIFMAALLLWPMMANASTIRNASIIAVVRIDASTAGAWAAGPKQARMRTAEIDLVVERTLKGRAPRQRLHVTVEQSEPGPRTVVVPGAWSGKSIERGARFVLFSQTDLSHADRVEPPESEATVKLALNAQESKRPLGEILARAYHSELNELMGEYILERLDEVLFSDVRQFDALLSFLESPGVPAVFRQQVLSGVFTKVMNADPAPQPFWSRLVVTGFRVAALTQAENFRDTVLSTFLPNLLGLTGGLSRKTADQVFQHFPEDRAKAREPASRSELLMNWLAAK